MKYIAIIFSIAIFLLAFILYAPSTTPYTTKYAPTPTPAPVNGEILASKVNDFRVENNLPALKEEESLCAYAQERAEQIKTQWNHNQFWADKCSKTNFGYCGENLSKQYPTEEMTLDAWKSSPTHLDNIKRTWSNMCIKCSDGYCAQEFGR